MAAFRTTYAPQLKSPSIAATFNRFSSSGHNNLALRNRLFQNIATQRIN